MKKECVFCKIIKKEIPSYKIYEDKYCYAFLDIANDAIGHTLVIPKKHYINILDCDKKTLVKLTKAVKLISNHYIENCGFSGINILNANNKCAGQSVFHFHIHIIPRKSDDGLNFWPKLEKQQLDLNLITEKLKIN